MATLERDLRRLLEGCVKDARIRAEQAVRESVVRLGVMAASRPDHLSEEDGALRRALRAHARALGDDVPRGQEGEEPRRLIESAAYVRWHRVLFVRFLAERGLLRHPDQPDIALTLRDCADFAREEGVDAYALAARYASRWLPAVFDETDPACRLELSPEHESALRTLIEDLPAAIFAASDSLGWTYQYWRAAEKDAINASGVKIGADELPAVTQLFTEPYMVRFLLDNTIGAWWAGKQFQADPALAVAPDEQTLRERLAVPGADWAWLRFVRETDDGAWRPAAGTFDGWPGAAAEITLLDPCCGSGHFLSEALPILVGIRQAEDPSLDSAAAVAAVLRDNLHGLEIDGRCVQIASFAVALSGWVVGGWQTLPNPHIAWVGSAPEYSRTEFESLGNGDPELRRSLGTLHNLFRQAPLLGSLIQVTGGDLVSRANLAGIEAAMEQLAKRNLEDAPELHEGAIAARGMADAAALLARHWVLQATNVPFLGSTRYAADLRARLSALYPDAKGNTAVAMIRRMMTGRTSGGTVAVVSPQNWYLQSSYRRFRESLLDPPALCLIAGLGPRAFESIGGEQVVVGLSILGCRDGRETYSAVTVSDQATIGEKQTGLRNEKVACVPFSNASTNEQSLFTFETIDTTQTLSNFVTFNKGVCVGDDPRFRRHNWEIHRSSAWFPIQTSPISQHEYSGLTEYFKWEGGAGEFVSFVLERLGGSTGAWIRGTEAWGRKGVTLQCMGEMPAALYAGFAFDSNVATLTFEDAQQAAAIWCYVSDPEYKRELRKINREMKVGDASIARVRYDPQKWLRIAQERYPDGLPEPYSDNPTQLFFHGHPAQAETGTGLHVALARLAGYRWPPETDESMRLSQQARQWIAKAAELPAGDTDGLLPLVACAGERPLAQRLREWCAAAFPGWSADLEKKLVRETDERLGGATRRSDENIDDWLRTRAFRQHCKLFHERPFLWQVWDGRPDGFSAFVHYQRFGRSNLEKLAFTLLGDWINRSEADGSLGIAEAGRVLQATLRCILEGEPPYDVFVRWKPLRHQPLGWDPDIDDGVRLNIRPFVAAGVLRDKVNVHWKKDRGTDVASAPWFALHKGERINNHHTTLSEKRAAREVAQERVEAAE